MGKCGKPRKKGPVHLNTMRLRKEHDRQEKCKEETNKITREINLEMFGVEFLYEKGKRYRTRRRKCKAFKRDNSHPIVNGHYQWGNKTYTIPFQIGNP